ncbi:MAG: NUDIX hydrolase [Lentisphaeria bacterium]|nr:NUDIX hydrolase [Lentisphaeria bacterium]
MTPERTATQTLGEGRFLRLDRITYRDRHGVERHWESAARQGGSEAVLIVAVLRPSGRLVLIRQYRPPVGGLVVEFPAGLVDGGESPAAAALRELAEETGYEGRLRRLTPRTCSSPGMTGEGVLLALVDIDEGRAVNRSPQPKQDEGEDIEVCLVEPGALGRFLADQAAAGAAIDSRTAAYALGLEAR